MAEVFHSSTQWAELRLALLDVVGEKGCLFDQQDTAAYCEDWRHLYKGRTPAVVRPASADEVASVVRLCAEGNFQIVPQGGNTGLMGGAIPGEAGTEVVLSLSRMNKIRDLDPVDMTMTVEAGVTLKAAQNSAIAQECMLPISMSSEMSAQIGGILSTNAGGNNTVRYGNARDLVLGLEVVFADGQIWNGLRRLRKDNTGYCLRQLLVGAEGTLGIITAAVLKLVPRPNDLVLAFCAMPSVQSALDLYLLFRQYLWNFIQAFEYMSGEGVHLVSKHFPDAQIPLPQKADHYVLLELADASRDSGFRERAEELLGEGMAKGLVLDAVLAGSSGERAALWKLREEQAEAHQRECAGATVLNDVAVPVSKVPQFITLVEAACKQRFPGIRAIPFGHVGDGNIHLALLPPIGGDPVAFLGQGDDMMNTVNEVVRSFDGSFSAEHGIGRLKSHMMDQWRGGAELEAMRQIKAALDPRGIMNPGKLLPSHR
jgi:FAD/FMN-containing dehydrogenase